MKLTSRNSARTRGILFAGTLALSLSGIAGCASTQGGVYTPAELQALWRDLLPPELEADLLVPFSPSDETTAAAQRAVSDLRRDKDKLAALLEEFFVGGGRAAIRYTPLVSATARETFARGEGNCGSLANLFVAMARAVGLRARFVDASREISRMSYASNHVLQSGHLTAGVWTSEGFRMINFDPSAGLLPAVRILDDREAVAHHYNNRGYELLVVDRQTGHRPSRSALGSFELSIAIWPTFARAHNNLGVALYWSGEPEAADQHYRAAISADPKLAARHANRAALAAAIGDHQAALAEYAEARRLEPGNPYAWINEGLLRHKLGLRETALQLLRGAVDRAPEERRAWIALIQVNLSLDRTEEAVHLLERFLERWSENVWARLKFDGLRREPR